MVFKRRIGLAFLVAAGLTIGACGDNSTDTTTTPTAPTTTPVEKTETFAGTLTPSGSAIHQFSAGVGKVTSTLVTVGPDSALAIGFGVGTWDGTGCTLIIQNDTATQGTYLIGTATTTISLCLKTWDVGNVAESATYSLSVVHY